ncbi:hypothetical protein GBAR_LOCUS25062 [Geodia barretti]|uniref:Uncharacterized protein n=1 Tax=Geodia barretti TaxID=519541 RepID=A0AA35TBJ1_GEOBA|nr:hypothetical protein GBAR_LOCUS25062 [Geodia barretti]
MSLVSRYSRQLWSSLRSKEFRQYLMRYSHLIEAHFDVIFSPAAYFCDAVYPARISGVRWLTGDFPSPPSRT